MQSKIAAVPTFLFFVLGKQVDRLDGANAAKLTLMVKNNVMTLFEIYMFTSNYHNIIFIHPF